MKQMISWGRDTNYMFGLVCNDQTCCGRYIARNYSTGNKFNHIRKPKDISKSENYLQ